ncbi:MAG: tripartite tricarboxylate transporter substrate binding protein [Geminicoccaceae bacterium]|nr:tripartite tricarboxylate transporter substrate binding protein [Geminicoccaceae bacterium]
MIHDCLLKWIPRALGVTVLGTGLLTTAAHADYPDKPIRIIVPTQAGGGMDSTARILQRHLEEQGDVKIAVVNMPGAGGTIGTRAIMEAEPDGYTVGFWHEGIITSAAMGVVDYDHTAFEVLGSTGYVELGFGVGKDNPIDSFEALLETAEADPDSVKCATNVGLPVHFVPLMVADEAGVDFRYVQVGGGAKRMPSVVAGHTDFAIFGVLEFVKFEEAGLKPIVVFADERSPVVPDVPTAKEHGVDVVASSSRIWLAPEGTPEDRLEFLTAMLRDAMQAEDVKQRFEELGMTTEFVEPEEVKANLDEWKAKATPLVEKARELQE